MNSLIPANAAVCFTPPVGDLGRAKAFSGAGLQEGLKEDSGPNSVAMVTGSNGRAVSDRLYPGGRPAASGTGNAVHLTSLNPLEVAIEWMRKNGGTVVVTEIVARPAGRFAYCLKTDENSFDLFVG